MLVTLALLVAMEVVLARFLGIQTPIVQIKLSFIPVVMAALLYGRCHRPGRRFGGLHRGCLIPLGGLFPGFTLTAALGGLVYGLVLYRKPASPVAFLPGGGDHYHCAEPGPEHLLALDDHKGRVPGPVGRPFPEIFHHRPGADCGNPPADRPGWARRCAALPSPEQPLPGLFRTPRLRKSSAPFFPGGVFYAEKPVPA